MRPKIAVLMDENTSSGGTRYEAHKGYFHGLIDAGGAPFGVPYALEIVNHVADGFDALLAVGGRFAYPDDWYVDGEPARSPSSPRFEVERAMMIAFLARRKPVLGICAGMQMLACLRGARLAADIAEWRPDAHSHDEKGRLHPVDIRAGSLLRELVGVDRLDVNTFHREAIADLGSEVMASAYSDDGIVEAVELPSQPFALGIQWHQELFAGSDHAGNRIFHGLVAACSGLVGPHGRLVEA